LRSPGFFAEIGDITKQAISSEILRLPPEKRIELLGEAWDAIASAPDDVPIPEWHLQELERRLSDPSPNYVPWEEVRARLKDAG
jgi:putative addiction module component (TIGR02574 family)